MGEETDGVVESTSKLQEKLKALTGVDILTDAGDYKDTYTILKEIGREWENLSDIDKAATLELMAGKNRANTLSAILTNMKDLEGAYESAMSADGSAMAENERYLDSIEGKITQFKTATQTMWMHFLDDKAIKFIVDLGTGLIKLVDNVGLLRTAFVGLMGYFSLKSKGGFGALDWIEKLIKSLSKMSGANGSALSSVTEGVTSAFTTLSKIQNVTLSVDNIRDVAAKIDGISNAARNGQSSLMDYMSTLGKGDIALKAYVESVDDGNYSLVGFQKFIEQHNAGVKASGVAAKAAAVGHALFNAALTMGISALISYALPKVIEWFDNMNESAEEAAERMEELRREAEELSKTYNDTKNELSDNLDALTISSDSDNYATLMDEFEELTKGVNAYGENISLTSDEYARYKEICETIVGIQPSIAAGYDSATEAIGNNAGVLEKLIALQKEEARLNAAEFVSYGAYAGNGNFELMAERAHSSYRDSLSNTMKLRTGQTSDSTEDNYKTYFDDWDIKDNAMSPFFDMFYNGKIWHAGSMNYDDKTRLSDNVAHEIMEIMGFGEESIADLMDKYYVDGIFDANTWLRDYADDIIEYRGEFVKLFNEGGVDPGAFTDWADAYIDGARDLEAASDYMIDAYLQVPYALKEYEDLSSGEQSFITEWIKNSDMFKIKPGMTTEEILAAKQTIIDMVRDIAAGDYVTEIEGKPVSADLILDQIFKFDATDIDYATYEEEMRKLVGYLWDAIGAADNTFGIENEQELIVMLGIDFITEDERDTLVDNLERVMPDKYIYEIQDWIDSQPPYVVRALVDYELWPEIASTEDNPLDFDDIVATIIPNYKDVELQTVKTYSVLSDEVTNYNELLAQTNELTGNNVEVTEEYKDALKELGITDEELNECFDENNELVVTNTEKLRKLVKEKEKEIAANVKLSKSQSQLEYYELVKQLNDTLAGTNKLDSGTRDLTSSILEQIDIVKLAIYQYQLLEDSLLGATNGFKEFHQAQEIDALNTYEDDYVSMAQTMYDAFYKTGEVGTAANWAAIEALVPDWVYKGLMTDGERMTAIYEYFNNSILPTLTLDEDQLSFEYDNIEDFVQKGLDTGVFEGDLENFNLAEGMNLEKAAEQMGYTETQAYALFATLDKFNTSGTENSFLSQLDDSLDGRIMNITNHVEELNREKLALLEGGVTADEQKRIKEINEELVQCDQEMEDLGKTAYETWQQYTVNDAALAALGEIENKQDLLTKEGATKLGLDWDEVSGMTVQQAYDYLLAKQLELEKPTVLTATLAIENIDAEIAKLQTELNNPATSENRKIEIEAEIQALEEDKALLATTFGITLSEEDQEALMEELNAIEEFTIGDKEFTITMKGASFVSRQLSSIKNAVSGLNDKTITVTVQEKTKKNNTTNKPSVNNSSSKEPTFVGGGGGHYAVYANGTAHAQGSWGAPRTETALVGELGPEMLVRNGRWTTVGDNGAEFTQIKKGDIIFNHKQTEELLSKGYVTGRGKAYAEGTAYSGLWKPTNPDSKGNTSGSEVGDSASKLSQAAKDMADTSDEFKEVFDWIEVRLEEINEDLGLMSAQLENAAGHSKQNAIVADMIKLNEKLYDNLIAGANKYYAYAAKLLANIPAEYRKAAQDGSIAIESFVGEVDEKTLEAIQTYREWAQKGADAIQQAEETIRVIADLAKQAIDNIAADYENKKSIGDIKIEQYEAYNSLLETDIGYESAKIYQAMIKENNKNIQILKEQRNKMLAELNKRVEAGEIKKYSQDWYDAVNDIAAVDTEIIELKTDTEDWQDAINDLHWDQFDDFVDRLEAVSNEAENLIDILDNKDAVDEAGNWTKEGITSLGLYAQQMEVAEMQAKQYKEEINYLNKNWKKLGYTEQEYLEKLEELKEGQYGAIQSYHDMKDAIVDLNSERVEAIKTIIEEEIEAYQELIEAKKEELDAEKDLYDFQKNVMEQQKDISDIQRQLAAISTDNSASARAQRARLEAELAEAQANLADTYYDRSIDDQTEALDKELEYFQETKEKEMEGWDEYLKNTELVVSDTLTTIQANTDVVYQTLKQMGSEYSLSITESLTSPWKQGEYAVQSYSEKFGLAMSATVEELKALEAEFNETMIELERIGTEAINNINKNVANYTSANSQVPIRDAVTDFNNSPSIDSSDSSSSSSSPSSSSSSSKKKSSTYTVKEGDTLSSIAKKKLGSTSKWKQIYELNKSIIKDPNLIYPGQKLKLPSYAKGTSGVKNNQLAIIDELGLEEIVMHVQDGKLAYLSKGSAVLPHDISENLMELGQLDPSAVLERSRPQIGLPSEIHNTEINFSVQYGDMVSIGEYHGDNPEDIAKMVAKQLDKHTKDLNNALRRYTRG